MTSLSVLVVAEISNLFHRRKLAISQSFFKISGSNFFCKSIEPSFRQLAEWFWLKFSDLRKILSNVG